MRFILAALTILSISGCFSKDNSKPIKTTYTEIQHDYATDADAANKKYSRTPVIITDAKLRYSENGDLVMLGDGNPYTVHIEPDSRAYAKNAKENTKLNLLCNEIEQSKISNCAIFP